MGAEIPPEGAMGVGRRPLGACHGGAGGLAWGRAKAPGGLSWGAETHWGVLWSSGRSRDTQGEQLSEWEGIYPLVGEG